VTTAEAKLESFDNLVIEKTALSEKVSELEAKNMVLQD
jgi:hypothetical protein